MKFKRILVTMLCGVILTSSITGCTSKKEQAKIAAEKKAAKEKAEAAEEAKKKEAEEEARRKEEEEKKAAEEAAAKKNRVSVNSLIDDAKDFIKNKKKVEQSVHVELKTTQATNGVKNVQIQAGDINSGFNKDFYYVREKFITQFENKGSAQMSAETVNYSFYVKNKNKTGYINSPTGKYKIDTDLIVDDIDEIEDFSTDSLAEYLVDMLILDPESCEISKTKKGDYLITERLDYDQIPINRSVCFKANGINSDDSVRIDLYFDKKTHKLKKYNAKCISTNASSNTEVALQISSNFKYKRNEKFPNIKNNDYETIDVFTGYSIF